MSYLLSYKIRTLSSRFIGFFLLIIVALSLSKWHFHASLIGYFLWLMGWLFVGVGAMGRIWYSIYISGYKNNKLVMEGPYSLCRNPLYLFSYLGGVGIMFILKHFYSHWYSLFIFWFITTMWLVKKKNFWARNMGWSI